MSYSVQASADLVQACFKAAEGTRFTDPEARAIGQVIASVIDDLPSYKERDFKKELLSRTRPGGGIDRDSFKAVKPYIREPFWQTPTFTRADNTPQYYADALESILHVAERSGFSSDEKQFVGKMVDNMTRKMVKGLTNRSAVRARVNDLKAAINDKEYYGGIKSTSLDAIRPYSRLI